MKYMGSKARIAKYILPIILSDRKPEQYYVEPFVGGCNLIDKVTGNRIGSDNNRYLISMFKMLQSGHIFSEIVPKDIYDLARQQWYDKESRKDGNYWGDGDIGWVGYMASANGRFFEGGYSGISKTKIGTQRNYIEESIRNIKKQIPYLQGVEFYFSDYRDVYIPQNSIVYCDIPYKGTKQYATSKSFNHDSFWEWCRRMSSIGHTVFISEYAAPDDFKCVWEMDIKSSISANAIAGGSKLSTEKLFTI